MSLSRRPSSRGLSSQAGATLLAAFVFVILLGLAGYGLQAATPSAYAPAQTAAVGGVADENWEAAVAQNNQANNTPASGAAGPSSKASTEYNSSQAPKNCDEAITRALGLNADETSVSVNDKSQSGTMDACYGAVLVGKAPSQNRSDYQCVGRRGEASYKVGTGSLTVVTTALKGSKPGTCLVAVCDGPITDSKRKCAPAKPFNGGVVLTNSAKLTDGALANLEAGQQDTPVAPGGANTQPGGFSGLQTQTSQDIIASNNATADDIEKFLANCAQTGNCSEEQKQKAAEDLKSINQMNAQLQSGLGSLAENQVNLASGPNSGMTITAGDILPQDYFCLTSVQPVVTQRVTAGTAFPSGCLNDSNAPPLKNISNTTYSSSGSLGRGVDVGQPTGSGGGAGAGAEGGAGGNNSLLNTLMGLFSKALGGGGGGGPACSTDPQVYQQQQQQYQQEMQNYNYQQQLYNYQNQLNQATGSNLPPPPPPQQPQACTPSNEQQCSASPTQPDPASCSAGSWLPVKQGSCIKSWRCAAGPTAEISCDPEVADSSTDIEITYSCSAGNAQGSGFNATGSSGTKTVKAPSTTGTITYGLTCRNDGVTSGAQCTVQVNGPSIIFVANPKTVHSGQASLLGWVTSGMESCVVSSPSNPQFTSDNAYNTSPNGTAQTPALATSTSFLLKCDTFAGGTKTASTTVTVN